MCFIRHGENRKVIELAVRHAAAESKQRQPEVMRLNGPEISLLCWRCELSFPINSKNADDIRQTFTKIQGTFRTSVAFRKTTMGWQEVNEP
jgi:hypothetical protein